MMAENPRQQWLSLLAKASLQELEEHWQGCDIEVQWDHLRPVETGLLQVKGRMGGVGNPFNLGDMTITRAAVATGEGYQGFGYVAGRSHRHAELVAVLDALLQNPVHQERLQSIVLNPLAASQAERIKTVAAKTAATKVDFFTVVRGED
ncbi:MAG: phosphonate C-P lyase system protein PhnG [Endozoicomonas sp.]